VNLPPEVRDFLNSPFVMSVLGLLRQVIAQRNVPPELLADVLRATAELDQHRS